MSETYEVTRAHLYETFSLIVPDEYESVLINEVTYRFTDKHFDREAYENAKHDAKVRQLVADLQDIYHYENGTADEDVDPEDGECFNQECGFCGNDTSAVASRLIERGWSKN